MHLQKKQKKKTARNLPTGDDMFASDDENTAKKAATATTSPPATTGGGTDRQAGDTAHMPAPVMPGVMPSTGGQHDGVDGDDGVDYASWPVKELRRFLQERGTVCEEGLRVEGG